MANAHCIICHDELGDVAAPSTEVCPLHDAMWHTACIEQWILHQQSRGVPIACPLCRHVEPHPSPLVGSDVRLIVTDDGEDVAASSEGYATRILVSVVLISVSTIWFSYADVTSLALLPGIASALAVVYLVRPEVRAESGWISTLMLLTLLGASFCTHHRCLLAFADRGFLDFYKFNLFVWTVTLFLHLGLLRGRAPAEG